MSENLEAKLKLADEIINIQADRLAELEKDMDGWKVSAANAVRGRKSAEAALATARRDALEEAAAETFEAWMDGVPASKICDRIRALIAQEEPTT